MSEKATLVGRLGRGRRWAVIRREMLGSELKSKRTGADVNGTGCAQCGYGELSPW